MKKITRIFPLLMICFLFIGMNSVDAQTGKKKRPKKRPEKTETVEETKTSTKKEKTDDYFDESGGFKHKLWFGGGLNLGFNGNQNLSIFQGGLSPMVGYKIFDKLSIGPRVGFNYSYIKLFQQGRNYVVEPISVNGGVFTRYKFLNMLFAHVEYERFSEESIDPNNDGFIELDQDGEIYTERIGSNNFYVGLGYTNGGLLAYEISLLYNVLEPENSLQTPFSIRAGFTYKF